MIRLSDSTNRRKPSAWHYWLLIWLWDWDWPIEWIPLLQCKHSAKSRLKSTILHRDIIHFQFRFYIFFLCNKICKIETNTWSKCGAFLQCFFHCTIEMKIDRKKTCKSTAHAITKFKRFKNDLFRLTFGYICRVI